MKFFGWGMLTMSNLQQRAEQASAFIKEAFNYINSHERDFIQRFGLQDFRVGDDNEYSLNGEFIYVHNRTHHEELPLEDVINWMQSHQEANGE